MAMATHATIRPDWDTSITYDVLRAKGATIPVFVGRAELLQPMVASICETRKRGTILISGYRGTGKTTLLIEALRQARKILEEAPGDKKRCLLPIVLNVSEVSASLEQQTPGTAGLSIDPKRLLIALMRSFAYQRRRSDIFANDANKDLAALIDELYTKAVATEFSRTSDTTAEEARTRSREVELSLKLDDFLRAAPFLSGIAAVVFALLGWGPSPVIYKFLAAAAAIATVALTYTWKSTRSATYSRADKLSYKLDNSLQQIENDLKDLLEQLAEKGFRTIVVLEELDKLDQGGEQQLDAVIRYFKNLFTQAPALFFFVTDKNYFDAIAQAIRDARSRRSYAVEHTFFTNRIFVGRPLTRDCIEYIGKILLNQADRDVLDRIYKSPRFATESHGPAAQQAEPLSLFARVLLFRAANHLFDLKNELRRYVRPDATGAVVLQFDAEMFPTEEQALAKFQDLIADKFRAFEIKGGRSYANEVLNDCLYSVFNQIGSAVPLSIRDLSPQTLHADGASPQAVDSLDIAEALRIEQAVRSLLEDLQRGLAITVDAAAGKFSWLSNAASVFSVVRRLEKHEDELVLQLKSAASRAELLISRIGAEHPARPALQSFVAQKRVRAEQVANLDSTISLDSATHEQRELDLEFGNVLETVQSAHRMQAEQLFGLRFASVPIVRYDNGCTISLMLTIDGDPRDSRLSEAGCVLLVQGMHGSIADDAAKFVRGYGRIRKLALIHVLPAGASAEECRNHQAVLEGVVKAAVDRAENKADTKPGELPSRAAVLSQDEPGSGGADEPWGTMLGRELVVLSYWATYQDKKMSRERREWQPLARPLNEWLDSERVEQAACFIEGVTDTDFVMSAVTRVVHDYGADAQPLPLMYAADEVFSAGVGQHAEFSSLLRASAAEPAATHQIDTHYLGAVRQLLADPATILIAQGVGPLQSVDATVFSHATRLIYLGVPISARFKELSGATVQLRPSGQFHSKSGAQGPGEAQQLTIRWGQYLRTSETVQSSRS